MTRVDQTLRQVTPVIDRPGPGQWRLTLPSLPGGSVRGRADGGWFRLTATADGCPADGWELLKLNARLPLVARCAFDPRTHRLMFCADVCLLSEVPLTTRIREACDGLVAAEGVSKRWDVRSSNESGPLVQDGHAAHTRAAGRTTAQLIGDCGWPVSEREGRLVVQVGVSASATVQSHPHGGLSVDSTLAVELGSDVARAAVARCLLATTGVVRGVRASVRYTSGKASVQLEGGFESAPCAAEVQAGLSALSVAWERCTREVRALQDTRVAEAYLVLFAARRSYGDAMSAVGRTRISTTHDGTEGGIDDDFGHDDPTRDDVAGE